MDPSRRLIQRTLSDIYGGPAWHGASLLQTVRSISAAQARRRPGPGRNTIWELVLHLAYTRHRVLARLGATPAARFPRPLARDWWPKLPDRTGPVAWRADLDLLAEYQARLLEAVRTVPDARLLHRRAGQPRSVGHELLNVAVHDAYHTGQIRLLLRLRPPRRS
jgi:uncharacterized damage-inducible protein DinB